MDEGGGRKQRGGRTEGKVGRDAVRRRESEGNVPTRILQALGASSVVKIEARVGEEQNPAIRAIL